MVSAPDSGGCQPSFEYQVDGNYTERLCSRLKKKKGYFPREWASKKGIRNGSSRGAHQKIMLNPAHKHCAESST